MVRFENVSQYYGNFRALYDIDFHIKKGSLLALLGPNGAGKSTTMSIMTGFRPPFEGEVFINGINIFENPEQAKSCIGYLGEIPPLYPELTVEEYLVFVSQLFGNNKHDAIKNTQKTLDMLKIQDRKGALIKNLSKGLKQRVGIAQSLLNNPKLLVLDEPTVGLEPSQLIEFRNLIRSLAYENDMTVVLSTHIMSEASELCDDVIIINEGKKIFDGTKDELLTKQNNDLCYKIVTSDNSLSYKELSSIKSISHIDKKTYSLEVHVKEECAEEIVKLLVSKEIGLKELTPIANSLEQVFLQITDTNKKEKE